MSSGSGMVGGDTSGVAGGGDDATIEYVVVDSNAAAGGGAQTGSGTDMSGLDSSIANALISSGGKAGQQFQIVKEDSDGNQVTTTVVLVPDPSSASGNDLIAMAIEDDSEAAAASGDVNTNTAPTYGDDVEDDGGISGIISGQGPVFITDGGGGSDVFRSADAGQYIIQEIHEGEEGGGDVGIHADPDYVPDEEGEVMTDDDNTPDNEPPEEQGPELLKGQKKLKMEKRCKDEDARFMKRKKILLSGIKVLEYKYLTGLKEAERKKKSIHLLNQEIKGIKARTALVEEAIKNGEANQEDSGGVIYKYEVIGS